MPTLRLFASAREVAGTGSAQFAGSTVADVLRAATDEFGDAFATVLSNSKVWVNGDEAGPQTTVTAADEVAVLPPVSGG